MNWFSRKKKQKSSQVVSYNYSQTIERMPVNTLSNESVKSFPVYTVDMLASLSTTSYVSDHNALTLEAFYSCILDQCGTLGSLPLKMYRSTLLDDRPERVRSGQEFRVFTEQPCDYMTFQEFMEFLIVSYRTNGAFYALPFRNSKGRIEEIIPFANQNTVKANMDFYGNVYYTYVTNDGKTIGPIKGDHMFIVKNMTTDGYTPVRPLTYQAELMNLASSQEENYKNLQDDGITAQMALGTDGLFDNKEARQRLKEDMQAFRGPNGRKEIPIFEQGLKPLSLNLTPQEQELLNNREFTVKRVCAINETMPHRIGAATERTSDKIYELDEAQFKKWNPLLVKIERAFNKIGGRYMSFMFDRKAFYAGSPARLVEAVEREVKGGLASVAEGREDLGRDFIPGTEDIFCIESNNCTYGSWDELRQIRNLEGESDE